MEDTYVPDSDHISRYCRPSHFVKGRFLGAAFFVRESEPALSVNWLEFLQKNSREDEILEIREVFAKKGFNVRSNGKFAVLNVGVVRGHVLSSSLDSRNLKIVHKPSHKDPSHSGIYNFNHEDDLIADLIAEKADESHDAE